MRFHSTRIAPMRRYGISWPGVVTPLLSVAERRG
jgi:hypothetical protein